MSDTVVICECFARDGLQNESGVVPTEIKVALIDAISRAGVPRVEATSYSHPERVPAFRDAHDVLAAIARPPGVAFKATCPNPRAVERAIADVETGGGADELSFLVSATDGHSERNLGSDRAAQWSNVEEMIRLAGDRFRLVGVISVAFGCPFDGAVDPVVVMEDAARFVDHGVELVTLGDTTGLATPRTVRALFGRLAASLPQLTVVGHFHDTRGAAMANCIAALESGCRHLDSSIGGVGGHPSQIQYGTGQTGNVCTEDLVDLLDAMGVATGIDLDRLMIASQLCEEALGRPLQSKVARAGSRRSLEGAVHDG